MIFQASMIMFHVNLQGCIPLFQDGFKIKMEGNVVYPGALARVKWH